jgi:Zn-dependent metalloprotease
VGGFMNIRSIVRRIDLTTLLVSCMAVAGSNAANASGKIYLAGSWVDANVAESTAAAPLSGFGALRLNQVAEDSKSKVLAFLSGNSSLLSTNLSSVQWADPVVSRSEELETHRVKKNWNGIEVMGGEALVHLKAGKILFANADGTGLGHLSPSTRIAADEASRIAFSSYQGPALRAEKPELKVLALGGEARLVYAVKVIDLDGLSSDVHYIDANTASEALVVTNVHTAANRKVLAGTGTRDDMSIVTDSDAENLINSKFTTLYSDRGCSASGGFNFWDRWSNPAAGSSPCGSHAQDVMASALSAWDNSGKVYDYFNSVHRRDSVDGSGSLIRSVVNFGGAGFRNAAWYNDRRIMLYGMGDGQRFNDFASSLDVVAHEITHGITSSTANLVYASESGALNESYSDVFGKLVAFRASRSGDWKIGRDLFRDGSSFIRDMENPEVGHTRDFKHRGESCNRFNDSCGVHTNSGIPNKAAVMIAKRIGLERFGKIYFLTLTQLLRSSSNFIEARAQTEAACATLYGAGHADCRVVSEAFAAVGI